MHKDNFDKGIDIGITENPLGFIYGKDVFAHSRKPVVG